MNMSCPFEAICAKHVLGCISQLTKVSDYSPLFSTHEAACEVPCTVVGPPDTRMTFTNSNEFAGRPQMQLGEGST